MRKLALQHLIDGFRLEYAVAIEFAAIEYGLCESEHVGRGRRLCTSRRIAGDDFKRLLDEGSGLEGVTLRHLIDERFRQGFDKARVFHAQRIEYVLLDIVGEGQAGNIGNDVSGERRGVIGIGGLLARRIYTQGLITFHGLAKRHRSRWIIDDQVTERSVFEAGRVRHDVAQRDRLFECVLDLEVLQVSVDIGIEVQLALLDQLHDGNPGEQLRHGTRPEQCLVRIDRLLLFDVREAIALCQDQLAIPCDRHGARRAAVAFHQRHDDTVDQRFERSRVIQVGRNGAGTCREQ